MKKIISLLLFQVLLLTSVNSYGLGIPLFTSQENSVSEENTIVYQAKILLEQMNKFCDKEKIPSLWGLYLKESIINELIYGFPKLYAAKNLVYQSLSNKRIQNFWNMYGFFDEKYIPLMLLILVTNNLIIIYKYFSYEQYVKGKQRRIKMKNRDKGRRMEILIEQFQKKPIEKKIPMIFNCLLSLYSERQIKISKFIKSYLYNLLENYVIDSSGLNESAQAWTPCLKKFSIFWLNMLEQDKEAQKLLNLLKEKEYPLEQIVIIDDLDDLNSIEKNKKESENSKYRLNKDIQLYYQTVDNYDKDLILERIINSTHKFTNYLKTFFNKTLKGKIGLKEMELSMILFLKDEEKQKRVLKTFLDRNSIKYST